MKNQSLTLFFILLYSVAHSQLPAPGNILWLRADAGVFSDNGITPAPMGQLVQVWQDQSGQGNHFRQDLFGRRPQLFSQENLLCSRPVIRFDIGRGTNLIGAMRSSGAKSIFIVFRAPVISGNPQTLLSIKGAGDVYTEILCTDHSSYRPISFMAEMPGSMSGGTTFSSTGSNITYSSGGNLFTLTYNGGVVTSPASYTSRMEGSPLPVLSSGLFGRLLNDSSSIGGRAPQQNYSFLTGDIAEIIVYDRVLGGAEIDQVESYLITKYGFFGSCTALPISLLQFNARRQNQSVRLDWIAEDDASLEEYVAEHRTTQPGWDSIGRIIPLPGNGRPNSYQIVHRYPSPGDHYYRLRMRDRDGKNQYSETRKVQYPESGVASYRLTPNLVSHTARLEAVSTEFVGIRIIDVHGRFVKQYRAATNTHLDFNRLPPGIYWLQVTGSKGVIHEKFIKQ